MPFVRHFSSSVVALAVAHVIAGCSEGGPETLPPTGGSTGVGGTAGAQGLGGSGGGASGSAGSASGSGGSTGGASTGGASTGGASTGGASAGGASTGGASTGGASTGGASTGGASTGGASTGGASTGGASGSGGSAGGGQAGQGGNGVGGGAGLGGSGGKAGASGAGGTAGSGGSGGAGSSKSAGCGKAPTLMSGNRTIQSAGQSRSYILRIPANYDNNKPYRLVFGYHWRGGTMQDVDGGGTSGAVWSYYGLRAQADDTTIFVAPQGIGNGWGNSNGDDLEFTDDMVALIQGDLCVDKTRVFALGFSYGGGMSYALACGRPSVFRAVAVYSGGVLSGCEGGTQPVAYLGIHGLGDGTLNISGGRSMRDRFVMNNGCTAQNPPEPSGGSQMHTCTTYQGCTAGYPVRWCAFDGGHTPGMVDGGGDDGARTWTKTEAWQFFSQF
jgi:poly(3-hydroxybutyrate) depolymerase